MQWRNYENSSVLCALGGRYKDRRAMEIFLEFN
jgi:hypothetical protein